jgi:SAM-dependent methyltransferase
MPDGTRRAGRGSAAWEPGAYEAWFETAIGAFVGDLERGALRRIVPDAPGHLVVDIGAGTGYFARTLADRFEIVAVDPAPGMCREGSRRGAGLPIMWCIGVAERLPLASSCAGGALFMTALEWVDDPGQCVAEAIRVVRPGGWLAVGFLSAVSGWAALYRRLADEGVVPWSTARFFTRADVEALVGGPADAAEVAVHLAPQAGEPWAPAEEAGRRAGNRPALEVLRWDLP